MLLKIRHPSDKAKVMDFINKLPDKSYDVTVNIHRQTRSIPQNKLYWLWLNCISKETGNDSKDLHEYFSDRWLPVREFIFNGEITLKPVSTTTLNTSEFKAYLDKIQIFASTELGIVLPNPEDKYFDEMVNYYSNLF